MGKQRVKATICNEAGEVELAVLEGTMGPEGSIYSSFTRIMGCSRLIRDFVPPHRVRAR
jgi:hypothetical protein